MLPSLLAREVQSGLKNFLAFGFEPSDPFFSGIMKRFTEDESRWMKGPYVQLGLPFRSGPHKKKFFDGFETKNESYVHQEAAWNGVCSNRLGLSTLIATGTGSGKTECFLYPGLDHCVRAKAEGIAGIKVLIIYPMNALATDQARRFAETVAQTPAFKGLRVGLYVGGMAGRDGRGEPVMRATSVITDRETLRKDPPDILLTNYKMLDYLLIRPKDSKLWSRNTPESLRYIVVDELHTFDGAQGTDLALLLRRLRARLGTPTDHLICIGTSATLGGSTDTTALRKYAEQVFSVPFPPDSVVGEQRLTEIEFLGDSAIEYVFFSHPDLSTVLEMDRYASQQEAVAAWFELFFHEIVDVPKVDDLAWRIALGEKLKKHLLFINLLKILKGRIVSLGELHQQMLGPLPEGVRGNILQIMDALLVLIAWARNADGLPFVSLKIHLWLRELRRMVAEVRSDSAGIELHPDTDVIRDHGRLHLPLLQCTSCNTTAWLSKLPIGPGGASAKISTDLAEIYNAWFSGQMEVLRLFPIESIPNPLCQGIPHQVCAQCGQLQSGNQTCTKCHGADLVEVFRITAVNTGQTRGGIPFVKHDPTCPACGSRNKPILLGARVATLGAAAIEQSWASTYNDDKKLIAFSDSVQDAAHRAGFFTARTYLNTVRTGISRVIDLVATPESPLFEFLESCKELWLKEDSPLAMPLERFVSEFIGPNMMWQRDWAQGIQKDGTLSRTSKLPERVQNRLAWQAFAEFTYLSHRGRSLDSLGKATITPRLEAVQKAAERVLPVLHNRFALHNADARLAFQWLWGFVCHLRRRGAIFLPELLPYARTGDIWVFANRGGRKEWLPAMSENSPHPVFLSLDGSPGYEHIVQTRSRSFYQNWLTATFSSNDLLQVRAEQDLYTAAIQALCDEEVAARISGESGEVIGLNPHSLYLETRVVRLTSSPGKRKLVVPAEAADLLIGMPCLDAPYERYSTSESAKTWLAERFSRGELRRVYSAEHTSLLERAQREELETRFKAKTPQPWYENLLSATPTLEMGVDIGDLSSVMLCSVPPNQASYLQRTGRAGRHDGNAFTITMADGSSPHDLYFFEDTDEMLQGPVNPPGIFLKAAEVLRRQLFAFSMDAWVASGIGDSALPDKTKDALDALDSVDRQRFPYTFQEFVLPHEEELLKNFQALLGPDLDDDVAERLKEFMFGTSDTNGLRIHLTKVLEELAKERKSHRDKADQIRKLVKEKKAVPQDEATKEEISRLERERQKKLELVREINERDLLNTLTDAGLIPNYTFPETGVELKSLLWRRKSSDDPADAADYISLPAERYERPAASALGEFAPENVFYANQRKVEIDQINMELSTTERWRLCPTCQHTENLDLHADSHLSCPRCGDPLWANSSQERILLRFRQAVANSNDVEARIDDSAEDREPMFFVRQLLFDFDSTDVKDAYRIKASSVAFGFEFIQHVTFRDINFGELSKPGDIYSVAGEKKPRPGFRLCRYCGQVQRPPRNARERAQSQLHAFDCEKRGDSAPENLLDCLYLYREFASEALRILMPHSPAGVDDVSIQSFMAAIRVGLKERFGGNVDHLHLTAKEEKSPTGVTRQYVVLYDSVPGGTGYLHELIANGAAALVEVFHIALAKLTKCSCNADPNKDGCYRCVYQYRLGHSMSLISRERARSILESISDNLAHLERVASVSDIYINPNFDSELEAKFIESLHRLSGKGGLPQIKLVQEIVHGKSGFLLEAGDQRYWVEPQVDLGPDKAVKNQCRPDFVFWPAQSPSKRKPIAVFCDGWTYHQDSIREDALKRSALAASGKFWVWSVTWDDVQAALDGSTECQDSAGLEAMCFSEKSNLPPAIRSQYEDVFWDLHSVAVLMHLICKPPGDLDDLPFSKLARHAAATAFLMIPHPTDPVLEEARAKLLAFWHCLSDWAYERPQPGITSGNVKETSILLRYWWPKSLATAASIPTSPGFVIFNAENTENEPEKHVHWKRWLRLFNVFQSLPGVLLATQSGLDSLDYSHLCISVPPSQVAHSGTGGGSSAWDPVLYQAMDFLANGLQQLIDAELPPPDAVGFELEEDGNVKAEAELIWNEQKVVLLLPEQAYGTGIWKGMGWQTVTYGNDWAFEVTTLLKAAYAPADDGVQK
jgi:DEAD/DEAH box helicase domain-containing protein